LKGGATLNLMKPMEGISPEELTQLLESSFPDAEFNVRTLEENGVRVGFIIETTLLGEDTTRLLKVIESKVGTLKEEDYSIDITSPSLGESFFREIIYALIIAFVLMGTVVFIIFRVFVPSVAVILSALSDIVVTLAIANIVGIKVSTAGLAAFLMLIGYSVDTDILLSTHVLKRRRGNVKERIYRAMRTGFMTTGTTLVAISLAVVFTKSEVIAEIMIIVLIGLLVDLVNTWLLNAGLLRMYVERVRGEGG
ncbi:hypothetical protein KY318_02960, partial [Candidatus Woesearchaeota archaeon]|nr:hypothetical protein [Candidatus Woesearchaeota archaeon]